ncbi:MAG: hypothetical protein AVDCRST_MAG70-1529 [uncultured Thermomicrobiales bacterium]|uniref:Uncharacterized protein n=1 Tax=uncultured Thermomicrobiales bacterium TaxID=1645740 RepID=A0A6J4UV16_9BACT|nr:MAG: hypothetical protein AVDCRST_MAG70-1529 [uncultured Thermomicrobiales bacterium]
MMTADTSVGAILAAPSNHTFVPVTMGTDLLGQDAVSGAPTDRAPVADAPGALWGTRA